MRWIGYETLACAVMIAFIAQVEAIEIGLEAEFATEVVAPQIVATPAEVTEGPAPGGEASRGAFVWAPGAPLVGGANGDSGMVRLEVDIPTAGEYAIWGRVVAWDGNSDSYWFRVVQDDPDEIPQATGNTHFRWGVAQGAEWHWDKVNHWLDGGTFDRSWNLPAGNVEIIVYTREDACMLDALFITDNLADNEADAGVRLPTDQDVAIQKGETTDVEASGKLATTWGELRAR